MKLALFAGMAALTVSTGQASAQCTAPMNVGTLQSALDGNYACGSQGSESWNELHSGGILTDYKKGPTDKIDPTAPVGIYTISSNNEGTGQVDYTYTAGSLHFAYTVQSNGGTSYTFCPVPGGIPLSVTIQPAHC
jgi:hypothetical protein